MTLLSPEIIYRASGGKGSGVINITMKMKVKLAVKDIHDKQWKIYAENAALKRSLNCKLDGSKVNNQIIWLESYSKHFFYSSMKTVRNMIVISFSSLNFSPFFMTTI